MRNIVVFGASSLIVQETLKYLTADNSSIHLIGRNPQKLSTCRRAIEGLVSSNVSTREADLTDLSLIPELVNEIDDKFDNVDLILIGQAVAPEESSITINMLDELYTVNTTYPIALLNELFKDGFRNKLKHIAIITSIAGERGKKKIRTTQQAKPVSFLIFRAFNATILIQMSRFQIFAPDPLTPH